MTGTSHPGTLALAAATTGVDGLEVIIPIAPNTSAYHYYRSNGLVRHPFGFVGEDIDCMFDFVVNGNSAQSDYCAQNVRNKEMLEGMDRVTGDLNEFWRKRDYLYQLDSLKAAVLMAHGFNDWNVVPEHSNRIYQALKAKDVPCQIYYHQGGHGGEPPHSMMNRWFAHYLHGVENGVQEGPHAWIVREKDLNIKPTAYEDYPNPKAEAVKLHLLAGSPEKGKLSTTSPVEQGKETLVDNFSFSGASLAKAESTEHRLMFATQTLTKPLHLFWYCEDQY